jgi:hypothetical protein
VCFLLSFRRLGWHLSNFLRHQSAANQPISRSANQHLANQPISQSACVP